MGEPLNGKTYILSLKPYRIAQPDSTQLNSTGQKSPVFCYFWSSEHTQKFTTDSKRWLFCPVELSRVGKYSWAAISLWNNFEIISGKFPRAEIKLFQTYVDEGWNNSEIILFHIITCNHGISNKACVLYTACIPTSKKAVRNAEEQRITVVQSRRNKYTNNGS